MPRGIKYISFALTLPHRSESCTNFRQFLTSRSLHSHKYSWNFEASGPSAGMQSFVHLSLCLNSSEPFFDSLLYLNVKGFPLVKLYSGKYGSLPFFWHFHPRLRSKRFSSDVSSFSSFKTCSAVRFNLWQRLYMTFIHKSLTLRILLCSSFATKTFL